MSELRSFIHSVESFGSVDGPGIRFILFTQGCRLRCQYCHNPDSWKMKDGKSMSTSEVMAHLLKYKEFFDTSGGGITVSGGEPLLQMPYLLELFKECKKHGIHTNIDTSGDVLLTTERRRQQLLDLLEYTDMVMLDIKLMDAEGHKRLAGKTNEHILELGRFISETGTPMWIRRVLVPGLTDDEQDLRATAEYISTLKSVEKVEVLPYHSMGAYKWEQMAYEYELKDVESPDEASVIRAEEILKTGLRK